MKTRSLSLRDAPAALLSAFIHKGMKGTIARVILATVWLAITLASHSQAAGQNIELFRSAGGQLTDFDGKPQTLDNGKVYMFKNATKMKIIKLEFKFDPVDDATGTSQVNNADQKKFLNDIKKIKDNNDKVVGITFGGDVPIPNGSSFGIDPSGFGNGKKITMTATLGKKLIGLGPSTMPAAGTPGVTSLSVSASGFPNGNINPSNVRVELSTICLAEALATTSANGVVSGDGDSKLISFLLPGGLDPGQYFISTSDGADGDANFESRNCSEVNVPQ